MMDAAKSKLDERINRYVRGELTAEQARELAQESLDSTELFEELTHSAMAKHALTASSIPAANVVRLRSKFRFIAAGVAATVVLAASLYFWNARKFRGAASNPIHQTAAEPLVTPTLTFSPGSRQPILLARDLSARTSRTELFRGAEPAGRGPLSTGKIVSIENRLAFIDLGSVDGLAKGAELDVFRGAETKSPAGRLQVTTVFRERARAKIFAGELRAGDRVRVPGAVQLAARMDQAEAQFGRGERGAGLKTAEQAIREGATEPIGERREAIERLATLQYQAGTLEAAEAQYQAAADGLDQSPAATPAERAAVWNSLGVIRLLRGDYAGAQVPLEQASKAASAGVASAQTLNNRGALAELRGDLQKAAALYAEALAGLAPESAEQRRTIETNLARVKGSHP